MVGVYIAAPKCPASKKYNDIIPSYLRNRPKKLVKHCMAKLRSSAKVISSGIQRNEENNFNVKSADVSGTVNTVVFSNENNFPKCTCSDFTMHFLPCKHMFAIFNKYSDVSWYYLPKWYRDSVHMTLDNDVIPFNDNVSQNEDAFSDRNIQPPVNNTTSINQETENQTSDCQGGFKSVIDSISSLLSQIRDVSYDVSSCNVLKETEASLREILNNMVLA